MPPPRRLPKSRDPSRPRNINPEGTKAAGSQSQSPQLVCVDKPPKLVTAWIPSDLGICIIEIMKWLKLHASRPSQKPPTLVSLLLFALTLWAFGQALQRFGNRGVPPYHQDHPVVQIVQPRTNITGQDTGRADSDDGIRNRDPPESRCATPSRLQTVLQNPPTDLGKSFPLVEDIEPLFTRLNGLFDDLLDEIEIRSRHKLVRWKAHRMRNEWWHTCLRLADDEIMQLVPLALIERLGKDTIRSKKVWHESVHMLRESFLDGGPMWNHRSECLVDILTGTEGYEGLNVTADPLIRADVEKLASKSLSFCYVMVLQPQPLRFLTELDTSDASSKAFKVLNKPSPSDVSMSCALPAVVTAQGAVVYRGEMFRWGTQDGEELE